MRHNRLFLRDTKTPFFVIQKQLQKADLLMARARNRITAYLENKDNKIGIVDVLMIIFCYHYHFHHLYHYHHHCYYHHYHHYHHHYYYHRLDYHHHLDHHSN